MILQTVRRSAMASGIRARVLSRNMYTPTSSLWKQDFKHQDRHEINTETTETTQNTSDQDVAKKDEAFNPNDTSPEAAKEKTRDGDSPLDVSPAGDAVNRVPPEKDIGKDQNGRDGNSQKGSPPKGGKGK